MFTVFQASHSSCFLFYPRSLVSVSFQLVLRMVMKWTNCRWLQFKLVEVRKLPMVDALEMVVGYYGMS